MIPLPQPDQETRFFWDACARKELMILRCNACHLYIHPPRPACRRCGSTDVGPARVSGRGVIHSYTVTAQPVPGYEPPFTVVLVDLEEQEGLRLVSQIVDVEPQDVRIGMPVEVTFRQASDDVWLPFFAWRR
ncbi:MAG: Zn-ribbon domain-containing OB-fold protein [Actinomycetota bacterium]|nr:Zn-ribbon domain-containing OB-fold protein [Actinomycetota bacterium]